MSGQWLLDYLNIGFLIVFFHCRNGSEKATVYGNGIKHVNYIDITLDVA